LTPEQKNDKVDRENIFDCFFQLIIAPQPEMSKKVSLPVSKVKGVVILGVVWIRKFWTVSTVVFVVTVLAVDLEPML
jgi:hypothetical protein